MAGHSEGFLKLVNEAKKNVKELTTDEVRKWQEEKRDFYFVDCREDNEWDAGYAQGAIHIGKGVIERDVESIIKDKNAEIVIYCGGGFRSALAAESLQKMGHSRVYSMDGGIREWREKGFPMEGK